MKFILLLFILCSCQYGETFEDRIVRQSKQYYSCRDSIYILTFNPHNIYLLCKDGTEHKAIGPVRDHQIQGCYK